ncbi:MAG: hypothetical protein ACLR6O_03880 [Eubacterium sp.]
MRLYPGEQQWISFITAISQTHFSLPPKGQRRRNLYRRLGQTRSLKDYITDIRDIACPSAKCSFGAVDYFPNQVMYLCADIDDLKRDTGFEPTVDFKTGIKNTVEWYKEQNNG